MKLIDAKGKACPIPVILAKQAISDGADAFTIQVDNTTAVENLKRLAGNQGFTVSVREGDGAYSLDFARAGAACPACEAEVDSPSPPPAGTTPSLWAGTSSAPGTGSWGAT